MAMNSFICPLKPYINSKTPDKTKYTDKARSDIYIWAPPLTHQPLVVQMLRDPGRCFLRRCGCARTGKRRPIPANACTVRRWSRRWSRRCLNYRFKGLWINTVFLLRRCKSLEVVNFNFWEQILFHFLFLHTCFKMHF